MTTVKELLGVMDRPLPEISECCCLGRCIFAPSGKLGRFLDKCLFWEDFFNQCHGSHSQEAQEVRKLRREAELLIPVNGSDSHESL